MNAEQINAVILNQLSDMVANFIKHPNNNEVKENFQIKTLEGFDKSIYLSLITSENMGQLSQL